MQATDRILSGDTFVLQAYVIDGYVVGVYRALMNFSARDHAHGFNARPSKEEDDYGTLPSGFGPWLVDRGVAEDVHAKKVVVDW